MDTNFDLYEALGIGSSATPEEIKKSYRRLALQFHPDKQTTKTPKDVEQATQQFQQIGFAYSILSDEGKRARYDRTGETSEADLRSETEWRDYFKQLWQGDVNATTIEEFKLSYQGSEEETNDIIEAFNTSKGDMNYILNHIMCCTPDDQPRFVKLVNELIKDKKLKKTPKWKSSSQEKAQEKRREAAKAEAKEAEEYAKELGVHDALFKNSSKKTSKGKSKEEDDATLKALIQSRQKERGNSFLDALEAKYSKISNKIKLRTSDDERPNKRQKVTEPTDEEFEKIQQKIMNRKSEGKRPKKVK